MIITLAKLADDLLSNNKRLAKCINSQFQNLSLLIEEDFSELERALNFEFESRKELLSLSKTLLPSNVISKID